MTPMFPPPDGDAVTGNFHLRYEDIAADGSLALHGMPHAIGPVFWRKQVPASPLVALRGSGIVPILTRLRTEGHAGPINMEAALRGSSRYRVARGMHDGALRHLVLDVRIEIDGVRGSMYGPPPPDVGTRVELGTVSAEHVFTRLFAKPTDRRVEALPFEVTEKRDWQPPAALLQLPAGATAVDELSIEPAAVVFGAEHMDANQHVNSLVYPRLFREAALRRMAALGLDTAAPFRFQDTAYRKPAFAGERLPIAVQVFELGDAHGAVAVLLDGPDASIANAARGRSFSIMSRATQTKPGG